MPIRYHSGGGGVTFEDLIYNISLKIHSVLMSFSELNKLRIDYYDKENQIGEGKYSKEELKKILNDMYEINHKIDDLLQISKRKT